MPQPHVDPEDGGVATQVAPPRDRTPATVAKNPGRPAPRGTGELPPPDGIEGPILPPVTPTNPLLVGLEAARPVELAVARRQAPVFEGTIVVYLGSNPHHCVSIRGQVAEMRAQDIDPRTGEVIEVIAKSIPEEGGEGISSYDFSLRDAVGRVIKERIVPVGHSTLGMYAGKTVQRVEHPDHLFHFYRAPMPGGGQMYAVICPPAKLNDLLDYFRWRASRMRQSDDEFLATVANATASAA